MRHRLSTRDIIRLYHTHPIQERIIRRPSGWMEMVQELALIQSPDKVVEHIVKMAFCNCWIAMHVLPNWLVRKHNISQQELEYMTRPADVFYIPFTALHHTVRDKLLHAVYIHKGWKIETEIEIDGAVLKIENQKKERN
jgi:hypothetical protein